MGDSGSKGGSYTSSTSGTPWEGQAPYLKGLFAHAGSALFGAYPVFEQGKIAHWESTTPWLQTNPKNLDKSEPNLAWMRGLGYFGDEPQNLWSQPQTTDIGIDNAYWQPTNFITEYASPYAPTIAKATPTQERAAQLSEDTINQYLYGTNTDTGLSLFPTLESTYLRILSGQDQVHPFGVPPEIISRTGINYRYQQPLDDIINTQRINRALDYLTNVQTFEPALNDVISGRWLNSNPYINTMYKQASDAVTQNYLTNVLPYLNTTMAQAGRSGSDTAALLQDNANRTYLDTLSKLAGQIYGSAYEAERGRMNQGLNLVGQLATTGSNLAGQLALSGLNLGGQLATSEGEIAARRALEQANLNRSGDIFTATQQYNAQVQNLMNKLGLIPQAQAVISPRLSTIGQLSGIGESEQAQNQAIINAMIKRNEFNQYAPWEMMGLMSNLISGAFGGTSNTVTQTE